jgi:hypothetical protein
MKRNLLLVASLFFGAVAFAQDCVAVTALNEDFSTFTGSGALPQKCWTGSNAFPMVYVDNALDLATIYTSTAATLPIYLVSPELSNIDGAHTLTFDVSKLANSAAGVLTLQVGTLATATDFANFAPVGDLYTLETTATSVEIVIPANATQKFIAFKIISSVNHMAAGIDNVIWSATDVPTPPCVAVASISEDFSTFNVLQNPANVTDNCWSTSATGPLLYADTNTDNTDTFVTFYANGSADTAAYLVSPELVAIDGTLKLSFDAAYAGGPGFITTVQAGTIATAGDFANFHPVGEVITLTSEGTSVTALDVPSTTDKFLAFKFTSNFAHGAATIDNIVFEAEETPVTPCEAVASIDEDFSTFNVVENPANITDNCWSTSANGPLLYADTNTDATDTFVTFYANGSADTAAYLITPELTTIDGSGKLSFDAVYVGGPGNVTTVQAGTIATAGDFANFHPVGEVITLTSTETSITDLEVPSTTDKFIAFKFTTNFAHGAASIDNVKYDTTAGIGQFDKSTFSIFPNPSVDKNITINHNLDAKGTVNVYTLTGSNVFSGELSNTGSQSLTLSSLSTGIYIVKIEAGNFSESKKLIIQ